MPPMSSTNIQQLVQRAQRGDTEAVGALYQMYAQHIYRYIAFRVSTTSDAEDLTAEVFVKMVEGLPGYRFTGAPFEAWLYRIASARVIDFRRRANRRTHVELGEDLSDTKPTPEEHTQQEMEVAHLRQALRRLSDEQQTILILRFIERKSHQEVADILGKSLAAVKTAQYRALLQLATHLGSEEKVRHYLRGGAHD